MSLGRHIDATEPKKGLRGNRIMQVLRLIIAALCLLGILGILRRTGIPTQVTGAVVGMAVLALFGLVAGISFYVAQYPHKLGRFSGLIKRMDPNRRLRLTRDGRILVGMTLAVGAAAVNTGNNFLYLSLGLLLALVSVSGVLSEWGLRDVRVLLEEGGERFANGAGLVAFHVFNQKKMLNSMSLEVTALLQPPAGGEGDVVRLPGRFFIRLPPDSRQRGVARALLPQRGVWKLLGFEVATAYPFGFFRKWKHEVPEPSEPCDVLVYPQPAPVAEALRRIRLVVGLRAGLRAGQGDEFFSLRDHNAQDDVRRVAWKRSARMGRLVVREDEEPRGRRLTLVVPGAVESPTPQQRALHEATMRVACGLVLALLDREEEIGLWAGAHLVLPRAGHLNRTLLLEALARATLEQPFGPAPAERLLGSVLVLEGPGALPPVAKVHGRIPITAGHAVAPTTHPEAA